MSHITTSDSYRLADLTRRDCIRFWASGRELSALTPYTKSQDWAERWQQAGFDGVQYYPRHDSRANVRSLALFGPIQIPDGRWPEPQISENASGHLKALASAYHLTVRHPSSHDRTIVIDPPR